MGERAPRWPVGAARTRLGCMTVDALDAIRKLSLDERIRLVEQIWDSVADDPDAAALPITPAQREELDRRLADAEARPGEGAPWF